MSSPAIAPSGMVIVPTEPPADPERVRWVCWCVSWGTPNDKLPDAEMKCWRCHRPKAEAVPKPAAESVGPPDQDGGGGDEDADQFRRASPNDLRAAGWSVAVHNDYRLNGEAHTFWLLTHPSGRYAKGEGRTDAEALDQIRKQTFPAERPVGPVAVAAAVQMSAPAPAPPAPQRRHTWIDTDDPKVRTCPRCKLEEHRKHEGSQNGITFVYIRDGVVVGRRMHGKPGVVLCTG